VAGHGGLLLLELETRGVAAHGSSPWLGINAIEEMRTLLEQIRSDLEHAAVHPRLGRPSLNLGAIRAGDAPNRVPDRCTALVDIRVVPPMTASGVMTTLENLLTQERWKNSSVKVIKIGEPFEAAADSLLVSALCEAGKSVLGTTPEIAWKRYWTEADPLRNDLGADVVVFGSGNGEQAHSGDEYVEIPQLLAAAEIYEKVARRLASPAPR